MIKYKVGSSYRDDIDEVVVVRETAKQLVVQVEDWNGNIIERRTAKKSTFENYFDTWEEAHNFVMDRITNQITRMEKDLYDAQCRRVNIKDMKKP